MRNFFPLTCLIACFYASPSLGKVDDDDDKPPVPTAETQAATADADVLVLSEPAQQLAGIRTQRLENAALQPEFPAYGTVVGLEPLLQLRQQYLSALAQQNSAKAKYTEAGLNLSRTQNLHQQDIVSTRRLQEQQAQWQSDKANLDASGYQQQAILAASRLEWGDTLTDWFVQAPGKAADQFIRHGAQLLQITLPANSHLDADVRHIFIDERGRRDSAIKATLISPAPRIDPVSQGERYFFKCEGRRIPFGTHISAWITSGSAQTAGVLVPESAVVRHLGQAFVYLKTAGDRFSRRTLSNPVPGNRGYFESASLQAGDEIVTIGAQTLLSQQLKAQIPSEDDD